MHSSPYARSIGQHQIFVQGYLLGLLHGTSINNQDQRESEQQLAQTIDARLAGLPQTLRDLLF